MNKLTINVNEESLSGFQWNAARNNQSIIFFGQTFLPLVFHSNLFIIQRIFRRQWHLRYHLLHKPEKILAIQFLFYLESFLNRGCVQVDIWVPSGLCVEKLLVVFQRHLSSSDSVVENNLQGVIFKWVGNPTAKCVRHPGARQDLHCGTALPRAERELHVIDAPDAHVRVKHTQRYEPISLHGKRPGRHYGCGNRIDLSFPHCIDAITEGFPEELQVPGHTSMVFSESLDDVETVGFNCI